MCVRESTEINDDGSVPGQPCERVCVSAASSQQSKPQPENSIKRFIIATAVRHSTLLMTKIKINKT